MFSREGELNSQAYKEKIIILKRFQIENHCYQKAKYRKISFVRYL